MAFKYESRFDGVHPVAFNRESGHVERVGRFDFDEVDRNLGNEPEEEPGISFSDASAAISLILQWACETPDLKLVGARTASLLAYLDSTNAPHERTTLEAIAKEAGCTRALLSKRLLELRDQAGVHLTMGKRAYTRDRYKKAQDFAVAAGVHSSVSRKDRKKREEAEEVSLDAVAG